MTPDRTRWPRRDAETADTGLTAQDAMDVPGPQVDEHVTVDVAPSVLIGARVPHLLLRDIPYDRGPFTSSAAALGAAEAAIQVRTLRASPVVDEHGYALGVLALLP